ncbi:MAG: helix-turn-helix domain-containing protein [Streptomycetales bacterium]
MGRASRELAPCRSMRHYFGWQLRNFRAASGKSIDDLAQATFFSKSYLHRVEIGDQMPSRDVARRCDEALCTRGILEFLWARVHAEEAPAADREVGTGDVPVTSGYSWASVPDAVVIPAVTPDGRTVEVTVPRRRFLEAGGASLIVLGLDGPGGSSPLAGSLGQIGISDVQRMRAVVRQLFDIDDAFGGDRVQSLAVSHLRRIQRVINGAQYSERVGRQLQSAAAEFAEHAGWLSFDAGRHDEARFYYNEALSAARLAGDDGLSVQVLASMSLHSTDLNRPREALNLVRLAQRLAVRWVSPKLTSLLAARRALAHAKLGEGQECRRALTRAARHLDRDTSSEPAWLDFYDGAELADAAALCHVSLGDHRSARSLFRDALAVQRPYYVRNRALYCSEFAGSLLAEGETEEACHVALEAADHVGEVASGRVNQGLRRFARGLVTSGGNTPEVQETLDHLVAAGVR